MQYILFGFQTDMGEYMISQIALYLLWIGAVFLINGQMLEGIMLENRYMGLIRFGSYRIWWGRIICRLLKRSLIEAFVVCIGSYISGYGQEDFWGVYKIIQAGILWVLGLVIAGMIQMICNFYWKNGVKIGFPILMLVEVISIYGGAFSKTIACFLPGSYFMLERSVGYQKYGYQYGICIGMEIFCILLIRMIGYKFGGKHD